MYYVEKDIKIFFMLMLLFVGAIAQNVTDSKGLKQGAWKKLDENGKLRYEGQFKDNIPYGTFTHYHGNGKLKAVMKYYQNGQSAQTTLYSLEGVREAQGKYLNQQKDSIWLYYDVKGEMIISQESYKNKLKEGAFIIYDKNAKPLEITRYSKGKKDGRWEVFYPNGKYKLVTKYLQGELDSSYLAFFEEGTKKIEGQFSKASREGNWFYYNANGSIQKQEMYKDGKLMKTVYWNGTFTNYYSDEVPKETFTYENGRLHGDLIEYYFNGTWVKKQKANDEGVVETYDVYEGQTMKSVCKYLDGLKIMCTTYKENGKVDKTEKFK